MPPTSGRWSGPPRTFSRGSRPPARVRFRTRPSQRRSTVRCSAGFAPSSIGLAKPTGALPYIRCCQRRLKLHTRRGAGPRGRLAPLPAGTPDECRVGLAPVSCASAGREAPPASQTISPGGVSVTERRTSGHNETPQCRGVPEPIRLRGVVWSHDRCTDQGRARRSGTLDHVGTMSPRIGRAV